MLAALLLACGSGEDSEKKLDSSARSGDATGLTFVGFPDVGVDATAADGGSPTADAGLGPDMLVDAGDAQTTDAQQGDGHAPQVDTVQPADTALPDALSADVAPADAVPADPNREALNALYRALLWRDVDPSGLIAFLPRVVQQGRGGLKTVASDISKSAEYLKLKPTKTPKERLDQLYRGLFARDPDSSGLASYLDLVAAGQDLAVVHAMIDSLEFRQRYPSLQ